LAVAAICCCALAGCVEWTLDQQSNLHSVGLPFLLIWSKTPVPENRELGNRRLRAIV